MSLFDEFRQPSEPQPAPSLAEGRTVDPPLSTIDPQFEFEREPATFQPCSACSCVLDEGTIDQRELRNIIFWEDPYGNTHCASCMFPPHLVMVRRVLVLVAVHLPSHYLVPIAPGEEYDQVNRPDFLKAWKDHQQRRERLQREAAREKAMEGKSDGY